MAADVLVMQGARALATMILTKLNPDNLPPHVKGQNNSACEGLATRLKHHRITADVPVMLR